MPALSTLTQPLKTTFPQTTTLSRKPKLPLYPPKNAKQKHKKTTNKVCSFSYVIGNFEGRCNGSIHLGKSLLM